MRATRPAANFARAALKKNVQFTPASVRDPKDSSTKEIFFHEEIEPSFFTTDFRVSPLKPTEGIFVFSLFLH